MRVWREQCGSGPHRPTVALLGPRHCPLGASVRAPGVGAQRAGKARGPGQSQVRSQGRVPGPGGAGDADVTREELAQTAGGTGPAFVTPRKCLQLPCGLRPWGRVPASTRWERSAQGPGLRMDGQTGRKGAPLGGGEGPPRQRLLTGVSGRPAALGPRVSGRGRLSTSSNRT